MQRVTHTRWILLILSFALPKGCHFSLCLFLPSPPPLLSHPCSLLLLLHAGIFSLIGLCSFHLFLYPPTLHADTGEEISLTLYLCHCSLFPSLCLSFSLFVSLCLYLCLPPSLPHILIPISSHTLDSFYTLQKHPSFCSEKEKSLLFLFFLTSITIFSTFVFRAVFSFPTPALSCGFNPKAGTNMFYFQLVIMAGTVLLAYYFEYTDTFPVHIQGFFCFDKAYSKPYPGPEDNSKAPPVLVYSLVTAIPTVTVSLCSVFLKNKTESRKQNAITHTSH